MSIFCHHCAFFLDRVYRLRRLRLHIDEGRLVGWNLGLWVCFCVGRVVSLVSRSRAHGPFSSVFFLSVTVVCFPGSGLQTPPPEAPRCRRTSSRVEFGVVGLFLCGEGCKPGVPVLRSVGPFSFRYHVTTVCS